jgi:putative toxin-antitoxin system antitoxin component (TIGR02293 family)
MPSRSPSETRTPPIHRQPTGVSEEGSLAEERMWLVGAAWNSLVPLEREVLTRFYLGEQPQDQICAEMGLTETQFRLLKSQARARFAELSRKMVKRKRPPVTPVATPLAPTEGAVADIDRVVPIVAHAVAVFGDEYKASHWLATPLALLGDRSPVQILARGGDFEAIDQILTRIEHNIPS